MVKSRFLRIILGFLFGLQFICLSVQADSQVISSQSDSSLAGFKIFTTVIRPDQNQSATSTVSTNNDIVKKSITHEPQTRQKASTISTNSNKNPIVTQNSAIKTSKSLILRSKLNNPVQIAKAEQVSKPTIAQKTATVSSGENASNYRENQTSKEVNPEKINSQQEKPTEKSATQEPLNTTNQDNLINTEEIPLSDKVAKSTNTKEPDFITMMTSLLLVIGMVFVFAWLYGRLKGVDTASLIAAKLKGTDKSKFNLLSSTTLGQGKSIHLVEIKGKQLVIGSTNNNINLLTEIGDSDNLIDDNSEGSREQDIVKNDSIKADFPEIYKEYLNNKGE